jgi:hypothetical protein
MKKSVFAFLIMTLGFLASAQEKQLLAETFESESGNWSPRNDSDFVRQMEDGKLLMKNKSKLFHWCGKNVEIEKKTDYKIETLLDFTKFQKGMAGIFWGGDDELKRSYFFFVSPDGTYQYGKWAPEFESKTGSTKHPSIVKGIGQNKITMIKRGGRLTFFINDVEVYSAGSSKPYGTMVGMIMGGGALTAAADYYTVTELAPE